MAKFLTGNDLYSEIGKLIENADEQIILISPYIKLHDNYASIIRSKKNNPKVKITIVFGKNEKDLSKSLKQEDFNFFKEFPNIEIRYEKRLHAKYYSNESSAILTSMNLYDYSQDHNIEAGILTQATLLGKFATKLWNGEDGLDETSWKCFERVIEQSELLFMKEPKFDNGIVGTGINKKYLNSTVELDLLSDYFANNKKVESPPKRVESKSEVSKSVLESNNKQMGYCIRTGKQIPFNDKKPMSDSAFQSWSKFSNKDYKEKFCHFSGEEGETSWSKPILPKNWKKAKEIFKL